MIARILTVTGPPGSVDRSNGVAAAAVVKSFQRMPGFLGGIVLVETEGTCVRTIGFWENEEAVRNSNQHAKVMGETFAHSVFGDHGVVDVKTFEVIGLDPPPEVPFPFL